MIDTHLQKLMGERLRQASYLLVLVVVYLFIDFVSYRNITIVVYGLVGFGVVLTIVNFRWGFYYLLGLYLFSDDTPRIMELAESKSFASVHFTMLGGYTLSLICTIFVAYMLHLRLLGFRTDFWPRFGVVDRIMVSLVAVYAAGGIIGLPNLLQFPREYMTDLGYIVNTIVYYLVVRIILNKPEDIRYIIFLLTTGYGVKCLVGIAYFSLGVGHEAALNVRVLFESGRTLLVMTFFLCLALILFGKSLLNREHRVFLLISGFAMVFNIITFASRLNMIFLVLGFGLFVYYAHKEKGGGLGTAVGVLMLVGISVSTVAVIRPGALDYVWWKLISLQDWSLNSDMDLGSLSIAIRLIQLLNIVYMHINEGTYIWGTGLGGWFTDEYFSYPADFIAMSVANEREIRLGRFFKPATMSMVVLLKFGFVGFIIYYSILIKLFITTGRIYLRAQDHFAKAVLLGILVALPVYFDKNHTSKINAFYGIAIGIVANVEQNNRKRRDKEKPVPELHHQQSGS